MSKITEETVAGSSFEIENGSVRLSGAAGISSTDIHLASKKTKFLYTDKPAIFRMRHKREYGSESDDLLRSAAVEANGQSVVISGTLLGIEVHWHLELGEEKPTVAERITLRNPGDKPAKIEAFTFGLTRSAATVTGTVLPELACDRFVAIPFRHRATDEKNFDLDFSLEDLIRVPGRAQRAGNRPLDYPRHGNVAAPHWSSEGWAWIRDGESLGVYAFSQERMFWSTIGPDITPSEVLLRIGGAAMTATDPDSPLHIGPGEVVDLGLVQYEIVPGGLNQAFYSFRTFLDGNGCRFPNEYDPPVHWNELYDNPEWSLSTPGHPPAPRMTRQFAYTKKLIMEEAAKAREYRCESLYLDPGWDTDFGTFLWGEGWLGRRTEFVETMADVYGLKVSLHCPLATWMAIDGRGVPSWPGTSFQMDSDGRVVENAVCLGSEQYLNLAEERLLASCADGVVFLMFDGTWWNGGCWNPDHGHPVPYTMEDHVRACLDLAQRVHSKFPDVVIEMHDMIAGGTVQRYTPVYYKYGIPGSYDENWGFELMWRPMEDIKSGRARSLYYYNLGCNVPLYLHVDLRDDNHNCLLLWWYASTCRHLGIGGTHPVPAVAEAQKRAMETYSGLSRFFKRGIFYGMNEEIHIHVLADENSFVVNLFNLSDVEREICGSISVKEMGIEQNLWYDKPKGGSFDKESGSFKISRHLQPWSTELAQVNPAGNEPT